MVRRLGCAEAVFRIQHGVHGCAFLVCSTSRTSRRTSETAFSDRDHTLGTGGNDNDRAVRAGDICHIAGMYVQHDQEQNDQAQHPGEERSEEPGVDFERPTHNRFTYPTHRVA